VRDLAISFPIETGSVGPSSVESMEPARRILSLAACAASSCGATDDGRSPSAPSETTQTKKALNSS
jgi:hypothetical protein